MREIRFFEPASVDEAVSVLAGDGDAKCLAGGASLVAMLNARLVDPDRLVSLRRIDGLRPIAGNEDGSARIGAGALHREVAQSEALAGGNAVVRKAASVIANPVIREMGTMGGSISHCDPAADYPPALVAAEAEVEIAGAGGRRCVAVSEFFLDWYATVLEPGDLVTAVLLPQPPAGSVAAYDKLAKVEGDMGIAMVAVVLALEAGALSHLAVAVGGCGPVPLRLREIETGLMGGAADDAAARLGDALADAADPVDDVRASADYRRRLIPRLVARAIRTAAGEVP